MKNTAKNIRHLNLKDIEEQPNYSFEKADIVNAEAVKAVFQKHNPDGVIHLEAKS